jgi:hypothetical protein
MPTAPYDNLEVVVNTARVRLNDAIVLIGGEILTDTAVFTTTVVNAAWRRLQELLSNYGFQSLNRELIYVGVPATLSSDQGIFVWFNWVNYYNGSALVAFPVLPQDMIAPLSVEERISGATTNFVPMDQVFNGLPTAPKSTLNRVWEWRQETIYMPGATGTTDIRLRYAGFLADFVASGTTAFTAQPVPIMRSLNSFAWFICSEMARARGDIDAGIFDQNAMAAAEQIWNRDWRQDRSLFKGSEVGKMTDATTPTKGPAGPRGPSGTGGRE